MFIMLNKRDLFKNKKSVSKNVIKIAYFHKNKTKAILLFYINNHFMIYNR